MARFSCSRTDHDSKDRERIEIDVQGDGVLDGGEHRQVRVAGLPGVPVRHLLILARSPPPQARRLLLDDDDDDRSRYLDFIPSHGCLDGCFYYWRGGRGREASDSARGRLPLAGRWRGRPATTHVGGCCCWRGGWGSEASDAPASGCCWPWREGEAGDGATATCCGEEWRRNPGRRAHHLN